MSSNQYLLVGPDDKPRSLWRIVDQQLEYLSLIDWKWHQKGSDLELVQLLKMRPISRDLAAELEGNRQIWANYWAYHLHESHYEDRQPPTTVVRRHSSPDKTGDEIFTRDAGWVLTYELVKFWNPGRHSNIDLPYLVEIDAAEAEIILQRQFGISGAASL